MANVPETQAWLDEMGEPTSTAAAALEAAISSSLSAIGAMDREISHVMELLQASDMAEPDAELRSMYEAGYQILGAQRRQITDLAALVRRLRVTQKDIAGYDAAIREKAGALGYTV